MRRCPKCNKDYNERPALSRIDNKTEICPTCGMKEAIQSIPKTAEERATLAEYIDRYY